MNPLRVTRETGRTSLTQSTRRDFPLRLAAILPAFGIAKTAFGLADPQAERYGISHTCESIHQEVVFKASRKRVYEALTQEKQFSQVTDFIMRALLPRSARK